MYSTKPVEHSFSPTGLHFYSVQAKKDKIYYFSKLFWHLFFPAQYWCSSTTFAKYNTSYTRESCSAVVRVYDTIISVNIEETRVWTGKKRAFILIILDCWTNSLFEYVPL